MFARPGTTVPVVVNGSRAALLLVPGTSAPLILYIPLVIRLAFLAVAALLAWRRPGYPAARALVAFMLCYALLLGLQNTVLASPYLSVVLLQEGSTILLLIGTAAIATFAAEFPSGDAPLPRRLARITQLLIALAVLTTIAGSALLTSESAIELSQAVVSWLFLISALLVVAILVVAYLQGAPSERQRRRWVFLLLGMGLVAVVIDVGVESTIGYSAIVDNSALLFIGAIPFGLAYVILRHRVIDVGFVINRALVYAIVSAIIVGIFVIVETLMSKYVEQHSRAGSIAVQLTVALILGFSIRFIHARVDRAVDRALFRQRYLDEEAIKSFGHDAHYITSGDVLIERCVATSVKHGHATSAGVWLRDGSQTYRARHSTFGSDPLVDENDPALVAMRARRIVADLHELGSTMPGLLAFPMIVRGDLIGALVCAGKEHGEAYAPDETTALQDLASAVGHALDAMRVRDLEARIAELETARHSAVE